MLFAEKVKLLKDCLKEAQVSYADSFKTDLLFYFEDFDESDIRLNFLSAMHNEQEILNWVRRVTSLIVMKFREEEESFEDFVMWCE